MRRDFCLLVVCGVVSFLGDGDGDGVGAVASSERSLGGSSIPQRLGLSDWAGIQAAHLANRLAVERNENSYRARNDAQRWTTTFDGRGFQTQPDHGEWSWGLDLVSYGWGSSQVSMSSTRSVSAEANRITYSWDEHLEEWYVNDKRGLEHGFTVRSRPVDGTGPLKLFVRIRGGLIPVVKDDGQSVGFVDEHNHGVVTYSGLRVEDAEGRALTSCWQPMSDGMCLRVEDHGARYPIIIDPLAQQAALQASNAGLLDLNGWSCAISGDTVVLGTIREESAAVGVNGNGDDNSAPGSGAVYVFVRTGSTWEQQAYLKASNTEAADEFGGAVAIDGDTIIVGARSEDSSSSGVNGDASNNNAPESGAAYVFVRTGSTWIQQAYIKASNSQQNYAFGSSVAIRGDTAIVGSIGESTLGLGSGAAYIYVRNGTVWHEEAKLKPNIIHIYATDGFGQSVCVNGDTAVMGSHIHAGNQSYLGAVCVFRKTGSSWGQEAFIYAPNPGPLDLFGTCCAISGDTLVVGAPWEDSSASGVGGDGSNNDFVDSGAAYVFVRNGTTWTHQAYLKASNNHHGEFFGYSVSIDGDTVVVGAPGEAGGSVGVNGDQSHSQQNGWSGAAYVFTRSGATWTQTSYVKAPYIVSNMSFGFSVGVSGGTVCIGAPNADDGIVSRCGRGYIFDSCAAGAVASAYGTGKAGTFGVPSIDSTKAPKLGTTTNLKVTGGMPGASPTLLLVGLTPSITPFDGGNLLVNPTWTVVLPPLDSSGSLTIPVPITVWSCGLNLYFQALFVDAGAAGYYHTAQTNGLAWTIGG